MSYMTRDASPRLSDELNLAAAPLDDATAADLRRELRELGVTAVCRRTGIGRRGLERAAAQLPILATHRRAIVAALGPPTRGSTPPTEVA